MLLDLLKDPWTRIASNKTNKRTACAHVLTRPLLESELCVFSDCGTPASDLSQSSSCTSIHRRAQFIVMLLCVEIACKRNCHVYLICSNRCQRPFSSAPTYAPGQIHCLVSNLNNPKGSSQPVIHLESRRHACSASHPNGMSALHSPAVSLATLPVEQDQRSGHSYSKALHIHQQCYLSNCCLWNRRHLWLSVPVVAFFLGHSGVTALAQRQPAPVVEICASNEACKLRDAALA